MSFEDLLNEEVRVYRKTNQLYSGEISASMTLTYQPPSEAVLLFDVSDLVLSNTTGTLTVHGVVGGAVDTEDFSFSGNGFSQGEKEFTSVSEITSSGITSGTLVVTSVRPAGQALSTEYLVKAGVKARIVERKSLISVAIPGGVLIAGLKMYCLEGTDILENDIVVNNSSRYNVTSVIEKVGYSELHHKVASIKPEATGA